MNLELTDEETAALLAELDLIIDGDRCPFSPRGQCWLSRESAARSSPRAHCCVAENVPERVRNDAQEVAVTQNTAMNCPSISFARALKKFPDIAMRWSFTGCKFCAIRMPPSVSIVPVGV
jgi:hypothetical protein